MEKGIKLNDDEKKSSKVSYRNPVDRISSYVVVWEREGLVRFQNQMNFSGFPAFLSLRKPKGNHRKEELSISTVV